MPALAPVSVTLFGKGSGSRDDISWTIGADPKSDDSGPYKRKAEGKFGSGRRGEHREESPREDGSRDWRMRPRTHEHLEPQKLGETRRESPPDPPWREYPSIFVWTVAPQNCEQINFYCFKPSTCSNKLQQS